MAQPPARDLLTQLRELRRAGRVDAAREILARSALTASDPRLAHLAWLHEPFWWSPLQGPRVRLRRRSPADAALVRRCWADSAFMQRFHRLAPALPADDAALQALLQREYWALPEESGALHWTIDAQGQGVGFVSAVEWSWPHRRAEFIIGLAPGAAVPAWAAPEAAHLAIGFLARQARLERLTACVYAENAAVLELASKIGFEREGTLRGHLRDPHTGARIDLCLAGLLMDAAYFQRVARQRQRLGVG